MAGIFGYVNSRLEDPAAVIAKMSCDLSHRGPDRFGYALSGSAAIGANHDASSLQPFWNEDGTVAAVLDGAIYNQKEVYAHLSSRGHRLSSSGGAGLLVHLYEDEGASGIERLAGMFACAIWDARRRCLVLARDRLGQKPLYVMDDKKGGFAFASEAKALLNLLVNMDIDPQALALYIALLYIPAPFSIWSSVRKLEPGHYAKIHDGGLEDICYWDAGETFSPQRALPGKDIYAYQEELRDLFSSIVKQHVKADVPIASMLSSGLDSTIVTALAAETNPDIRAYTVKIPGDDETPGSAKTAERIGIAHELKEIDSCLFDDLPLMIWHFDEPFGDSSFFPTFAISKQISMSAKIALSGDGGDEVFGGYSYYRTLPMTVFASRYLGFMLPVLSSPANAFPESISVLLAKRLGAAGGVSLERSARFIQNPQYWSPWGSYCYAKEWASSRCRKRVMPRYYADLKSYFKAKAEKHFTGRSEESIAMIFSYLDLSTGLPGDMLAKVDRMSMAHSLEVRAPFCDHRLIEWLSTMPERLRNKALIGKRLLKETFRDKIPERVSNQPKRGFCIPLGKWLEHQKPAIGRILTSKKAYVNSWADDKAIARMLTSDLEKDLDARYLIWALLVLEVWATTILKEAGRKPAWSLKDLADDRG